MRPLSASECISPAIDRTRLLLFHPFRKGRTWKLCATAYLTRMACVYLPVPLIYLAIIPALHASRTLSFIIAAVIVVATAFFTWLFHLCSRLQFAYFHMVATNEEFVAPAWRRYRDQGLPWTGFKVLLGSVFTAAIAMPLLAWFRHMLPVFEELSAVHPGQPPDAHVAQLMAVIYGGYGLLLLFIGLAMLFFGLLGDFVLPSLALENTGYREAFRRMGVLIRDEPGEFALYVLLKVGIGVVGYFAALIAWEIAFFLVTAIVGGIFFAVGFALHAAGIPTIALAIPGILMGIAWYFFAVFYLMLLMIGPVLTFMDAFAIYFLGGRYPLLGDMVDRSTPPPDPAFSPAMPAYLPPTA